MRLLLVQLLGVLSSLPAARDRVAARSANGNSPQDDSEFRWRVRERKYWTYIVANRTGDLYIGMTSNLHVRVMQHKSGD